MLTNHNELNLLANKKFKEHEEMYKIVDFLNKSLKKDGLIFGLTKQDDFNIISIYNTKNIQKNLK
jgi:hypothetical protein